MNPADPFPGLSAPSLDEPASASTKDINARKDKSCQVKTGMDTVAAGVASPRTLVSTVASDASASATSQYLGGECESIRAEFNQKVADLTMEFNARIQSFDSQLASSLDEFKSALADVAGKVGSIEQTVRAIIADEVATTITPLIEQTVSGKLAQHTTNMSMLQFAVQQHENSISNIVTALDQRFPHPTTFGSMHSPAQNLLSTPLMASNQLGISAALSSENTSLSTNNEVSSPGGVKSHARPRNLFPNSTIPQNTTTSLTDTSKHTTLPRNPSIKTMISSSESIKLDGKQVNMKKGGKDDQVGINNGVLITPSSHTKPSQDQDDKGIHLEDGYWAIESIVDKRKYHGQTQYLVRWKGCSEEDDTWEPESNLSDSAMKEFEEIEKSREFVETPELLTNQRYMDKLHQVINQSIESIKKFDDKGIFLEPFWETYNIHVPDYLIIIKEPICIKMIKEKTYKTLKDFARDIALMFDNALLYNEPDNDVTADSSSQRKQQINEAKALYSMAKKAKEDWEERIYQNAKDRLSRFARTLTKYAARTESRKRPAMGSKRNCLPNKRAKPSNRDKPKKQLINAMAINACFVKDGHVRSPINSTQAGKMGKCRITSFSTGGKEKLTFFNTYFKDRVLVRVEDLSNYPTIDRTFSHNCYTYELASFKMKERTGGGEAFWKENDMEAEFLYVATSGPDMEKRNLQEELEAIADFGSLGAKVCSRLELGQSEAKMIETISFSHIEWIPERGNEGCGFFPAGYFNCDVIQFRMMGPKLGVIKGLLCAKQGIERIQISESLQKVLCANKESPNADLVSFIVKRTAPSETNKYFNRAMDPEEVDPPPSFLKTSEAKKPLSKMYQRMLLGYGVPKELLDDYVKNTRCFKSRKHATVMGIADPTDQIPYGWVFIPGYANNSKGVRHIFGQCLKYGKLIVSRSPCVVPSDIKILPVLGEKPDTMSVKNWDFLCKYEFGTIIFGSPRSNLDAPIPNIIADGDLDGDLYFILWDDCILNCLLNPQNALSKKAISHLMDLKPPADSKSCVEKNPKLNKQYDEDWLEKAQTSMMNAENTCLSKGLVGKLYNLCHNLSKTGNGYDLYNTDSIAAGLAYKDAMDVQKHGGRIYLPAHLHDKIDEKFRHLLTSDP